MLYQESNKGKTKIKENFKKFVSKDITKNWLTWNDFTRTFSDKVDNHTVVLRISCWISYSKAILNLVSVDCKDANEVVGYIDYDVMAGTNKFVQDL